MIAEPIFVLLIYALLSDRMTGERQLKELVLLLVTVGLITAHYSLAYLYLLFVGFSCIVPYLVRKATELRLPHIWSLRSYLPSHGILLLPQELPLFR